jgi:hypothetical protein
MTPIYDQTDAAELRLTSIELTLPMAEVFVGVQPPAVEPGHNTGAAPPQSGA